MRGQIMLKLISIPKIKLFMNILILIILVMGSTEIITKSYKLFFKSEEIDILRVDIPWNHPINPVTVMLDKNVLQNDPVLLQKINIDIFTYNLISSIVFIPLMLLLLIQLKKLIIAIRGKTFFELPKILIIRNLSILVGMWVICNFIFYQIISLVSGRFLNLSL